MNMETLKGDAQSQREKGQWNMLIDTLKRLADHSEQPRERVSILFEIADVYRSKLNLHVMVISTHKKILSVDPNNVQALDQLAAHYESLGRWHDLIQVLRERRNLAPEGSPDWRSLDDRIASIERDRKNVEGKIGKAMATVGAGMIASSIIMQVLLGIPGATMHDVLQLGGAALGVVGIVMWRSLKI